MQLRIVARASYKGLSFAPNLSRRKPLRNLMMLHEPGGRALSPGLLGDARRWIRLEPVLFRDNQDENDFSS